MKEITKIETFDGKLHDSEAQAKRHIENLYGLELSKISNKFITLTKIFDIQKMIDENLDAFIYLKKIKDDLKIKGV